MRVTSPSRGQRKEKTMAAVALATRTVQHAAWKAVRGRGRLKRLSLPERVTGGLAAEFFEVLFDFESGHAARASGGDGLAVAAVLDVSAGVDAVELHALTGDED